MDLETPITTQEQLDTIVNEKVNSTVQARLAREAKKYDTYTSPEDLKTLQEKYDRQIGDLNGALAVAKEKAEQHDKEIAERDAKIKSYETASVKTRIAHEAGLPYELHSRLSGETEEEIRKDAEALSRLLKASTPPPLAAAEKPVSKQDAQTAAYKNILQSLKGEN